MAKTNKNDKNKQNLKSSKFCNLQSAVANLQQDLPLQMAPYVTDLVKPNVVGYFSQPAEILANLGPWPIPEKSWSNFDEPGEKLNLPCGLVEF